MTTVAFIISILAFITAVFAFYLAWFAGSSYAPPEYPEELEHDKKK